MRNVTLILVDASGALLGALPSYSVESPWWPDTAEMIDAARERFGLDVTILRLLSVDKIDGDHSSVTYLAQAPTAPESLLTPIGADLADHPLRAPYARVGGPMASLAWAADALRQSGRGTVIAAEQRRTWNLSSIWRLTTEGGPVWLKEVPSFFAHESAVIGWLSALGGGPDLIAADGTRMLLGDVSGDDLHGAALPVRHAIAEDLHRVQLASIPDLDGLRAAGVPDLRGDRIAAMLHRVIVEHGAGQPHLDRLAAGLDGRLAAVAACGLPDTLVHGDLHPGNVRGDATHRTIIDWGDSFLGHPAFDILRLCDRLDDASAAGLVRNWVRRWESAYPGSRPLRSVELLRPIAALRNAAVYAGFLAAIEPSEHAYHAQDVPDWLGRAAAL